MTTIDSTHAPPPTTIQGILFSRSVRSTFTSLSLIPLDEDGNPLISAKAPDSTPLLVRLQFAPDQDTTLLRSFCRRTYKLGDWVVVSGGKWEEFSNNDQTPTNSSTTEWSQPRLVVDVASTESSPLQIRISHYWDMTKCQEWQQKYFPRKNNNHVPKRPRKPVEEVVPGKTKSSTDVETCNHHGGGLAKRQQGEHIAKFLIASIMYKLATAQEKLEFPDSTTWSTMDKGPFPELRQRAIAYLNAGSGVLDVAGGSGHVSMALGIMGVRSTVIDAREGVGKLPGRDRKIWNRALKGSTTGVMSGSLPYCQPVVPFQAVRAWFGHRPGGVDASFRHPDQQELEVCDTSSPLLSEATAIVALHPDEATADIVTTAVDQKLPLVVIPCCVFARLFPDRRISSGGAPSRPVSTYEDLLQYLASKSETIQQTSLPFDGKHIALWSIFDE